MGSRGRERTGSARRRRAWYVLPVLLAVGACLRDSSGAPAGRGTAAAASLHAIADRYFAAWLVRNAESATFLKIEGAPDDRLTDNSPEALARWRSLEDSLQTALAPLDPEDLDNPDDRVLFADVDEALESSIGARVCHRELWDLNPAVGWQVDFPAVVGIQPVGTPEARESALRRWSMLPRFVDNDITQLREGLRRGYLAADVSVRRVADHTSRLLDLPPAESPYMSPAQRDTTPEFVAAWSTLVRDSINPALARYRDFLVDEYLPAARTSIGVSANPDGVACYRALIREFTTVDMSGEQVYEMGLRLVADLKQERERLAESLGIDDLRAFRDSAAAAGRFASADDMLAYARATVERADSASADWFPELPIARIEVQPVPEFQQTSAPGGQYLPAASDGSHPGVFRLNTYRAGSRSRIGLETLTFHEAIPGHHFQISLAAANDSAHPLTRYMINSGFAEGWALYAERLADEMGLFSDPAQRLAMINSQMFRAARMVVDPGIHVMGWSRQQAMDYLGEAVGARPEVFAFEVDRYISWPGQAPSYQLGAVAIRSVRAEAEAALGDDFDIKTFHGLVIEDGSVPISYLERKIRGWAAR